MVNLKIFRRQHNIIKIWKFIDLFKFKDTNSIDGVQFGKYAAMVNLKMAKAQDGQIQVRKILE